MQTVGSDAGLLSRCFLPSHFFISGSRSPLLLSDNRLDSIPRAGAYPSAPKEPSLAQILSERQRERLSEQEEEMAEGGRKDRLGGRDRHRESISGVVLGLRWVSVADGYLWIPVHSGIRWWTGSGGDFSLQAAVGLEKDSSWCVPVILKVSEYLVSKRLKNAWKKSKIKQNRFCFLS